MAGPATTSPRRRCLPNYFVPYQLRCRGQHRHDDGHSVRCKRRWQCRLELMRRIHASNRSDFGHLRTSRSRTSMLRQTIPAVCAVCDGRHGPPSDADFSRLLPISAVPAVSARLLVLRSPVPLCAFAVPPPYFPAFPALAAANLQFSCARVLAKPPTLV